MMSAPGRARHSPLVYATVPAIQQAARLLPPGEVLERVVQEAVLEGALDAGEGGGLVFLEQHGLVAQVVRKPGRTRPRPRSWLVIDIRPDRRSRVATRSTS